MTSTLTALLSVISVLLTAILALVGLAYRTVLTDIRGLKEEIRLVRLDQQRAEVRYSNVVRVMFLCLSRLHPDKGSVISETMSELFLQGGANGKSAGF